MAVLEIAEPGPSCSLVDQIRALGAGFDGLASSSLTALDLGGLEEFTVEVLRVAEKAAALKARAVAEADRRALARRQRSIASTTAFFAAHTHGPTASIAPAKTNGLWLIDFPDIADAWAAGDITEDHVRELRKADNPRVHQCMVRDQHLHISAAQSLEYTSWLSHLAYWLLAADPDGTLPTERERSYGIRFRTDRTGDVHVTGTLDPLAGEALLTMVEHEAAKIRRGELEDDVSPIHQSTMKQRNMVGLLRLCKRGFQRPDGGWPAPLVNIVMSPKVATDLISRMLDGDDHDPVTLPLDHSDIDRRSETIRGTPLDPRRAWPALISGRLIRQVMTAPDQTVNLGCDVRLFNAAQRQALLVESRGQCTTHGPGSTVVRSGFAGRTKRGLRPSAARSRSEATYPSPRRSSNEMQTRQPPQRRSRL